jgi:hypothetical protein
MRRSHLFFDNLVVTRVLADDCGFDLASLRGRSRRMAVGSLFTPRRLVARQVWRRRCPCPEAIAGQGVPRIMVAGRDLVFRKTLAVRLSHAPGIERFFKLPGRQDILLLA